MNHKATHCKRLLLGGLFLALIATPMTASAQPDDLTIVFFAPSVHFDNSVARANFISDIAARVEDAVGIPVAGVNVSSSSDVDDGDFAIVDGLYWAGSREGDARGSAEGGSGTSERLALIVSSSGPSDLAGLNGGTLVLPRVGSRLENFVTNEILRSEVDASDFFDDIDTASTIESALGSVRDGSADATVAFESYGSRSGLSVLDTYSEAPLPIIVQINDDLDEDFADDVVSAIRGSSGGGGIEGFSSFDSGAVDSFRGGSTGSRRSRNPVMTRARGATMDSGDLDMPEREESLGIGSPLYLLQTPDLDAP